MSAPAALMPCAEPPNPQKKSIASTVAPRLEKFNEVIGRSVWDTMTFRLYLSARGEVRDCYDDHRELQGVDAGVMTPVRGRENRLRMPGAVRFVIEVRI